MVLFNLPFGLFSNTFIFQIFIPFIILFAILWGLLEAIPLFRNSRVKIIVSLCFALIASYTNSWLLAYIATLGSYMAVVLFGILFLFGVVRWGFGRGKEIYQETAPDPRTYERLAKEHAKLVRKINSTNNQAERLNLLKRADDIEKQMKLIEYNLKK